MTKALFLDSGVFMKQRLRYLSFILVWTVLFFCGVAAAQQNNIIVPNVEGVSQGIAAQILRTAGLQPSIQGSNSGTLVVRQEPHPGSLLPSGGEVVLFTATAATQAIPASRSVPTTQTVSIQTSAPAISTLPSTQRTVGTNIQVTPLTTTLPSTQAVTYSPVTTDSMNFIIARHPQQAPANKYLLTETTFKRYPIWYPRTYLQNQELTTALTTTIQPPGTTFTSQVQPFAQSSVSPYLLQMQPVPQQHPSQWYAVPQGWSTSQAWTTPQTGQIQYVQPMQQTWPTQQGYSTPYSTLPVYTQNQMMVTGPVPVPNVMRMHQADAIFAIQKAGLVVGNVILVQNAQTGARLVINQSPRSRSIVPAGARVDLWIAN